MNLTIRFYATLKDRIGASEITLKVPKTTSVNSLLSLLLGKYPVIAPSIKTVLVAVNQEFAGLDQILAANDEIVLFPPVSGG